MKLNALCYTIGVSVITVSGILLSYNLFLRNEYIPLKNTHWDKTIHYKVEQHKMNRV